MKFGQSFTYAFTVFGAFVAKQVAADHCGSDESLVHISLSVTTDDYPAETAYILKDADTETIFAQTTYGEFQASFETYGQDICVPKDLNYEFTIYDEYGDGIYDDYNDLADLNGDKTGISGFSVTVDDCVVVEENDFEPTLDGYTYGVEISKSYTFGSECPGGKNGGGAGDPHFKTWAGDWYDFHGQCDMVMLDAPDFDNGSGLLVHVRTSIRYEYSYIESVAVKIGNDILEVGSWGDYFLNGVSAAEVPNKLSRFPVSYAAGYDQKEHALEIDLDGKSKIVVKSFKDMLSVMFLDATKSDFGNSVGLMGSFSDGSKIARDGKSVLNDVNAFAQEWQVLADEPKLFQTIRLPQHPEKCIMPEVKKTQRRLGASIAREAAEKACAHWKEDEKEACVYDVLATGDLETARAGAF